MLPELTALVGRFVERWQKPKNDTEQKVVTEQSIHGGMDFRSTVALVVFATTFLAPFKDGMPVMLREFAISNAWICAVGGIFAIVSLWVGKAAFVHPNKRANLSKDPITRMHGTTLRKAVTHNVALTCLGLLLLNGAIAVTTMRP